MSLTRRVHRFLLAYLAAVLVAVTGGVFVLAGIVGRRMLDERLQSALATLAAAIEVKPDALEWEPEERLIPLGAGLGAAAVRWELLDGAGTPIGRSRNYGDGIEGTAWERRERLLEPPSVSARNLDPGQFRRLLLIVGAPHAPVTAAALQAAAAVGAISAAVWLLAAAAASRVCRQALLPVAEIADAAERMSADALTARLPEPGTRDELARLAAAFNGLLGRLQDSCARQRGFAAEASHQLRTPLAALIGQAEVALRRERSAAGYRETLAQVLKSGRHLQAVVETLLTLARPTEDTLPPAPFDAAEWLARQQERWRDHVRAADLIFHPPPSGERIAANAPVLETALDNLLGNAVKYSLPGTPIEVRLRSESGAPFLEVADRGIGWPEADGSRLFEPFFRSEVARRHETEGAGLGLAVVARCADALGLGFDAALRPGGGGVFRLGPALPRRP